VWITFFDSKYTTKTGYFLPSKDKAWTFTEQLSFRLGDAVDVVGDTIAVGRPYGEIQGQDGDLAVYVNSTRYEVSTYRGVRAVMILGDSKDPEVLAADGWHQNYGHIAQGRLTLAKRDPVTGRFASQVVDWDHNQYGFSKLSPFSLGGKSYVAALGNKELDIYSPTETWKKTVIYNRTAEDSIFDFAYMGSKGGVASFLILDKGLKLASFKLP